MQIGESPEREHRIGRDLPTGRGFDVDVTPIHGQDRRAPVDVPKSHACAPPNPPANIFGEWWTVSFATSRRTCGA
jgi:hypothetical protein